MVVYLGEKKVDQLGYEWVAGLVVSKVVKLAELLEGKMVERMGCQMESLKDALKVYLKDTKMVVLKVQMTDIVMADLKVFLTVVMLVVWLVYSKVGEKEKPMEK